MMALRLAPISVILVNPSSRAFNNDRLFVSIPILLAQIENRPSSSISPLMDCGVISGVSSGSGSPGSPLTSAVSSSRYSSSSSSESTSSSASCFSLIFFVPTLLQSLFHRLQRLGDGVG